MLTAPTETSGLRVLRGPERVAALLMTLEKSVAGRLLKHFDQDQIREITRHVADLRPIPSNEIDGLVEIFVEQFISGASLIGTKADAEQLLEGVLPPEKISEIMLDLQGNADRTIWDRLSKVPEATLAVYAAKEHPQTAALILSRVTTAAAAKVLSLLDADFRSGLMRRMVALKPVADDALRILERSLHEDFRVIPALTSSVGPHRRIADIVNKMDRQQVDAILTDMAATRPEEVETIKSLMFGFEDISKLSLSARTAVLDKLKSDQIVMSLRGASAELKDVVLTALGARMRRMVEQELASAPPVAKSEVSKARREITTLIMDMAAKGEINLHEDAEEMVA